MFAGDLNRTRENLHAFNKHLESKDSFLNKYRASPNMQSSIIDGHGGARSVLETVDLAKDLNP